jgi:hypothetical protein
MTSLMVRFRRCVSGVELAAAGAAAAASMGESALALQLELIRAHVDTVGNAAER